MYVSASFLSRTGGRCIPAVLIALSLTILSVAGARAHEHREIADGAYEIEVGFLNEPAVQEEVNALFFRVTAGHGEDATEGDHDAASGEEEETPQGVTGLEDSLQADVTFSGQTISLDIRPINSDPGSYRANFIPTAAGAYTFRIYGTLEAATIDESFTSGPETFAEVSARDDLQFPATNQAAQTQQAIEDAQSKADSASTLGLVGLIVGVLGVLVGIVALLRSARGRPPATGA